MLGGCALVLLLGVAVTFGTEIFELYSTEGEITRNAAPESRISFDAPLRISKHLMAPVSVSLPEPSVERIFRVSPAVVEPGGTFVITLRDSIGEDLDDAEFINITVHGMSLNEAISGAKPMEEMQILQIYLMDVQKPQKQGTGGETRLTLNASEYTVNITSPFQCTSGRTLAILKVNDDDVNFDQFVFNLFGEYADLFQLDAVVNGTDGRFLELKFSDDCTPTADNDDTSLTPIIAQFFDQLMRGIRPAPMILQISTIRGDSSTPPSIYLIYFASAMNENDGDKLRKSAIFQSSRPIEVEIAERARHFAPSSRLKVYGSDGTEANPARNFTFRMSAEPPVDDVFDVHFATGMLTVRSADLLTLENLGAEPHFNISLYENGELVDSSEVRVHLRPFNNAQHDDAVDTNVNFRFEQPVYAFAAGPGVTDVGRVRLLSNSVTTSAPVTYAISEGGASYFLIDPQSGQITYRGPLERNAKNYTIKAIAYNAAAETLETTSVQILVAGIGSSPPQIPKKFDVVEISAADAQQPQVVYTVRGADFDPDARLHYHIVSVSCLSILGQPLDDARCADAISFGTNGQRNGTLIFSDAPTNRAGGAQPMSQIAEFVHRKTDALASAFVNVSVTDVNHPLEPSDYAALVIRVVHSGPIARNSSSRCQHKFDTTRMARSIQLDDSLPPNSYVYTTVVCTPSLIDDDDADNGATSDDHATKVKVSYSLLAADDENARFFAIHPETGIIRNVVSLKEAPRSIRLTVIAKDDATGITLDTTTLTIECQNLIDFAPEFSEKSYTFDITRTQFDASEIVGTIFASGHSPNPLQYEIIDLDTSDIPFRIDQKARIRSAPRTDAIIEFPSTFYFFVRAIDAESGKFASIPVKVKVVSNTNATQFPRFGVPSPQKATLMENSPVGTFVSELSAENAQRFEIRVSNESVAQSEKTARLISVLSISAPSATIRTFAPLSGLDGFGYWLTIVAYSTVHDENNTTREVTAELELEIDVVATSKCMPIFATDEPLVFDVKDTRPNALVAQLHAKIESGCELAFEVGHDSEHSGFKIVITTGSLIVSPNGIRSDAGEYDGRGIIHIPLTIIARSGHVTTSIGVEMRLSTNASDGKPISPAFHEREIRYRVPDVLKAGTVIGRVNTLGCDTSNGSTTYIFVGEDNNVQNDRFSLNSTNGEIRIMRTFENDDTDFLRIIANNDLPEFHMRSIATCGKDGKVTPQPADIFVEVLDLNNHNPQFGIENYEFSVDKKELIDTVIGRIFAYDRDFTEELYYSLEKTSYYRRGTEKRLRGIFFEVDARSGEIILRNSLAELAGGVFELSVRVRDTPPPLLSMEFDSSGPPPIAGRSSTTTVQVWVSSTSDYISFIFEENPLCMNTTKISTYLKTMAAAAPPALRPAHAILHDARYHFVDDGREILRNSTVLRVLFVDVHRGEIIAPSGVEEFIRDLLLPGLKPFESVGFHIQFGRFSLTANFQSSEIGQMGGTEPTANMVPGAQKRRIYNKSQTSALLFTILLFVVLLVIVFTMLAVIMCYYRQRFLRERQFLRDARIAEQAMSSSKPSTIRQFALANALPSLDTVMADRAAHYYPPNPYITEAWLDYLVFYSQRFIPRKFREDDATEPKNLYYATQEMKISMG